MPETPPEKPRKLRTSPRRIGWTEYVDLPAWGVRGLRAKMDTGARTSAIHVDELREHGSGRVRFAVVLQRAPARRVHVSARVVRRGRVRSSNGHYEMRVFVRTALRLGALEREIELSLVDRRQMAFRMLLGRSALQGLLIDVAQRDLLGLPGPRPRRSN
jgi:hypothetical protein